MCEDLQQNHLSEDVKISALGLCVYRYCSLQIDLSLPHVTYIV